MRLIPALFVLGFVSISDRTVFGLGLLIHQLFRSSLCFFVQAAFGLRTPCLAVLLIGPILRPFDPAIFLVFDMGEDSGGGSPPCSESEEADLRPGALDLPPHVSTPSYFV